MSNNAWTLVINSSSCIVKGFCLKSGTLETGNWTLDTACEINHLLGSRRSDRTPANNTNKSKLREKSAHNKALKLARVDVDRVPR